MCYKDEDEKLWQEDPYEYIRMKFSEFSNTPVWNFTFKNMTWFDYVNLHLTLFFSWLSQLIFDTAFDA